jgi:2-isopropylmalate synthase
MVRRRIEILDTTLRDGGKLPFAVLTLKDRVALARRLARLGVDVIEAGYPVSSPEEAECVAAVAGDVEGPYVAALARCAARDVEPTLRALEGTDRPYLHLFMPVSAHALAGVVKRSAAEALEDIQACIQIGREAGARVAFSPSEAPQADRAFLGEALAACREAGADVFDIADTNGTLSPAETAEIAAWACRLGGADGPAIGIHCHNDLGLAAANTLAGLQAGAVHAEVTLGGVGERAGNASLEQLAVMLEAFGPELGLEHGIQLEELWGAARLLEALTGVRAHPNAPIIGEAALAPTPGSHARRALEPRLRGLLEPRTVGRPPRGGGEVPPELVEELVLFRLESFSVQTGSGAPPAGVVAIRRGDARLVQSSHGAGPVDALFRAVDRAIGFNPRLALFSLHALSTGPDAPAEVTVTIEHRGRRFHGRHASPDAIEASLRAYLAACDAAMAAAERGGPDTYVHGEYLWE